MDFAFSEEQEEFRRYVRAWLSEHAPIGRTRSILEAEHGFDRGQWASMAEMGWQAMAIPEKYGGAGFGLLDLVILFEEQGRALLCGPFFPTVALVATALIEAGSEDQKAAWLPRIASGEITAAMAGIESDGITAREDGSHWVLDGVDRLVVNGHTADLLVVAATTGEGRALFLIDAELVKRSRNETLDVTRPLATVRLDRVRVGAEALLDGDGETAIEKVTAVGVVALAAEQVGVARRCLEMAVSYAKDRHQFGRPIGSFQAIKHKCADMLMAVETARVAAMYAAWTMADGAEEWSRAVSLAKTVCSEAAMSCASENIQIHGGIGFTWEHDAHLFFRRAKGSEMMLGDPANHRRRLAEAVL